MRPRSDTLLVWTGPACSYGCSACPIDQAAAPPGVQLSDLQLDLAVLPATEGRLAVLLGGEPLLRRDLFRLIAPLRSAGCAPGIITTGRPLVYPQVRQRLRRAGIAYLRIQMFGYGEGHDRATAVPEAYEQALAGLQAWIAEGVTSCDVDVSLSTRGRAIETVLSEVEALARELPASDIQILIATDPATLVDLQEYDMESWRRAVVAVVRWNQDVDHPLVVWEGLPHTRSAEQLLTASPLRPAFIGTAAPPACCLGKVEAMATATAGLADVRANSFNFVRTSTSVPYTANADACSAHAAAGDLDLRRQLWLIVGEDLVLYSTDTGDFDAADVGRIKTDLSHLFLDRATPGVLDDITEGMRRVLPDPTCNSCPNEVRCGHRFRVVDGPPFARQEAWIARYIANLRGRVLDVGCGEQLYRNELAPLVRSGLVQYTGLDPDELSLARLRAALPEGRFHLGGIEDFHGRPASYDHILCLRSLNHVDDVDEALARMAHLLKPAGSLLVVECTPFAMLRRREQVTAADHAPRAGHQHLRNLASDDLLPFARRRSLRVLEHQRAILETTNEWILLLGHAKPPAA